MDPGLDLMSKNRFSTESIVPKLREIEVILSSGQKAGQVDGQELSFDEIDITWHNRRLCYGEQEIPDIEIASNGGFTT